jgi:hypothetical protein
MRAPLPRRHPGLRMPRAGDLVNGETVSQIVDGLKRYDVVLRLPKTAAPPPHCPAY